MRFLSPVRRRVVAEWVAGVRDSIADGIDFARRTEHRIDATDVFAAGKVPPEPFIRSFAVR